MQFEESIFGFMELTAKTKRIHPINSNVTPKHSRSQYFSRFCMFNINEFYQYQ